MTFLIHALPRERFELLFGVADDELVLKGVRRMRAHASPGYPCRVSLQDAAVGETVLLMNYEHQPAPTPYRAAHAIFVREQAVQARPGPGEVPEAIARRLLSVRAFDAGHMLVTADVIEGRDLKRQLDAMLATPDVAYIHLHHAKQGCYAARVERVGAP